MSMIERVAEAIVEAEMGGDVSSEKVARAAIAAMREPTEAILLAGFDEANCHIWQYDGDGAGFDKDGVKPLWQAMIDEALNGRG